jgi:hypothetical protein
MDYRNPYHIHYTDTKHRTFSIFLSFFRSVISVPIFPVAQYTNVPNTRWLGFLSFPSLTELLFLIHISDSIQNNKDDQFLMKSYRSLPFLCQTTLTYYSQHLISSHCTFFEPAAPWQPLPFRCYFMQISLFTTTVYLHSKATYLLSHL